MFDPVLVRKDFPIFGREAARHFLDSAASSQKPQSVIDAMSDLAANHYANVHRGAYTLSIESTEVFERARTVVAGFVGAGSPDEVVITRGATTSLNMVAWGWGGEHLRPGDRILLSTMEHHANLVPWQMVARRTGATLDFVGMTDDYRLDMDDFEAKLDDTVKVVSVTGMSNVLGTMPPLDRIIAGARSVGAISVVDAAQLVPHHPVDVTALGADFVAVSAHKMLGPTGIGFLWGRPEALAAMEPVEGGGEMISTVELRSSTWAPIPHRFEAGTPPIIEAAGLIAAIEYLEALGMDKVARHDRELTDHALALLAEVPGATVYGPPAGGERGGVVSFTLGDAHPHDLATILDQHGVAVRAGHHCAKPLMREIGVPATARASFYVYNTKDDVEALIRGLETASALFGI
ncbi:MAG TPA: SufS family cysteine desulfurase [Acidimicrobiia bacterium]|nr:SufS family cysteine desulfurase [Acidimicrobiia bacterium]